MTRVGRLIGGAVLVALLGLLSACGGGSDDTPVSTGTIDPSQPIEITIEGDSVAPNGARVQIERDQQVTLSVTSDRAGELHLHTSPEQTLTFGEGTTEIDVVIDRPGVADMELHDPDRVVLQFEVR